MVADIVEATVNGAVYTPAEVIVPIPALPPVTPLTCQLTAMLAVLVSVAVNS
jgi:hypothetical protein